MSDMAERMATVAREAKVLHEAAQILDNLDSVADGMVDEGEMEADEEIAENIGVSAETCKRISVAMTMALAQNGMVPDFEQDLFDEEGGDDDSYGGPSAFA